MSEEIRMSAAQVAAAAIDICERTGSVALVIAGREHAVTFKKVELNGRMLKASFASSSSRSFIWHIALTSVVAAIEAID